MERRIEMEENQKQGRCECWSPDIAKITARFTDPDRANIRLPHIKKIKPNSGL